MSSSRSEIRPMPFRTRVGAIWELIPPAPIHSTRLFENPSWSNPEIPFCRSSAPGTALPRSLIDVLEPVNAGCIGFHSFPIDFEFNVFVEPLEPHVPIETENCHQRQTAAFFTQTLEVFIRARSIRARPPLVWSTAEGRGRC